MSAVFDVERRLRILFGELTSLSRAWRAERDRIKAEFKRRLDTVRFGQVDWEWFTAA